MRQFSKRHVKTKHYLATAAERDEMRESFNLVADLALILDVTVEDLEIGGVQLLADIAGKPTKVGWWLQQVALLNFLLQG